MMRRNPSPSSGSRSESSIDFDGELESPFGRLETLRRSELRETAYEVFFMSCRSSAGFGGSRSALNYYGSEGGGDGSWTAGGPKGGTGMMVVNSRIKKALGLKARRPPSMRTMNQSGATAGNVGPHSPGKVKRPMTSAEIMRQQMRVTDQSDCRLRKTLMRTLVGQVGRRAETIILPLELLRQLKPSEFNDAQEYHQWQMRQLKLLEAGLILYAPVPLDRLNSSALRFREVIRSSEQKPIDTSKNSEAMRNLCNSVVALAWRSTVNGSSPEVCHWADGYPMNVHLYLALLQSIFDLREETVVLDEVDELLELMKKTWTTLGINRMIHNACFTWVLFQRYVITGEIEPDLICAAMAMLVEVANDARRSVDREPNYLKVLSSVLLAIQGWTEKRLLDYHENFDKGTLGNMENILSLALATTRIISEDVPLPDTGSGSGMSMAAAMSTGNRVDYYIRSAIRNAFTKIFENGAGGADDVIVEVERDPSEILIKLAKDTEELALVERETFSPVLRTWHPNPTADAAVTIHNCFGIVLKQYVAKVNCLTNDLVRVLHSAAKLEKFLVQMVVEDSVDCEDGGKGIVREMIPYEVDTIVVNLLKTWIDERLRIGKECLQRAKETESWIPRSKSEPYAQSAVDLMKVAQVTADEFFDIPVGGRNDMVQDLADGLETIFQEYISFVASCAGTKQTYVPALPPLTRCNQESTMTRLWKKASSPCNGGANQPTTGASMSSSSAEGHQPKPSTSRGTQRFYIRLNTLHYVLAHLHSLDKSLSLFPRGVNRSSSPRARVANSNRCLAPSYHFDLARSSVQSAIQYVSELAAYRLIFLDSHHSFYDGLYLGHVANARIRPALRILKQNLTLLISILVDRAQPLAVKEVMRIAFEAFLMVLLAGGSERAFIRADHEIILEDFRSLKKAFCTCGEGLVAEEVVQREAEVVEGIVELMGLPTERLIEDFSIAACESSALLLGAGGHKLPMPPTTGRWNRTDPNTILRVLCHRDDGIANQFLKRMFQLPKRR